jgi:hypothetical protein
MTMGFGTLLRLAGVAQSPDWDDYRACRARD